jgi:hypothetical protein
MTGQIFVFAKCGYRIEGEPPKSESLAVGMLGCLLGAFDDNGGKKQPRIFVIIALTLWVASARVLAQQLAFKRTQFQT